MLCSQDLGETESLETQNDTIFVVENVAISMDFKYAFTFNPNNPYF